MHFQNFRCQKIFNYSLQFLVIRCQSSFKKSYQVYFFFQIIIIYKILKSPNNFFVCYINNVSINWTECLEVSLIIFYIKLNDLKIFHCEINGKICYYSIYCELKYLFKVYFILIQRHILENNIYCYNEYYCKLYK